MVELEPDEDLRLGLRAYVLFDDTLAGAPIMKAHSCFNDGNRKRIPRLIQDRLGPKVNLAEWRL